MRAPLECCSTLVGRGFCFFVVSYARRGRCSSGTCCGPTRARTRIPNLAIVVGIKNRDIYIYFTYKTGFQRKKFANLAALSSGAAFWIGTMSIVKSRKGNNIEWKKGRRERPHRGNSGEGPQFEVQGYHVLIFVAALMGALWLAGFLPDP